MAKNARSENTLERQQGESAKAFEAFDLYCKLGEERSVRKVAQKLTKSDTLIKRWSSQWNWVSRARDYDNELKRQEIQEQKKAYKAMQQRQIAIAVKMQKTALEALKKLSVEDMKPKDIKEFIKLGAEMERANMIITEQSQEENKDTAVDIYLPEKDGDNGE